MNNNNNTSLWIFLFLYASIIIFDKCGKGIESTLNQEYKRDTIIQIDTTFPAPIIVNLPRQRIPTPTVIYIDSSKKVVLSPNVDTTKHMAANVYQDSLEDENLTLYYSSIVQGELLKNALDYKLKIPKQITKTIEVSKPYPSPVSAFYLKGGVGGNVNQFSSITVGLQFVSKKGWSLGYDYDILENTHSVNLGIKLFQLKNKK